MWILHSTLVIQHSAFACAVGNVLALHSHGDLARFTLDTRHGGCQIALMQTVTLDDAQRHLTELVRDLPKEGEFLITHHNQPVARLTAAVARPSLRDLKPSSVGAVLRPFPAQDDDLLGEMLDAR